MRTILFAVIAVIALQGCSEEPIEPAVGELDFLSSNGDIIRTIEVEFAEDDESRATGLMHRRQLSLGEGMLFIFPAPDSLSFWMANTPDSTGYYLCWSGLICRQHCKTYDSPLPRIYPIHRSCSIRG